MFSEEEKNIMAVGVLRRDDKFAGIFGLSHLNRNMNG